MSEPDFDAGDLAEILSMLPEIVVVVDRDRKIRFLNRFEEGYSSSDVIGADALDFVVAESRESHAELLDRVFETGESAEQVTEMLDARGESQWYRSHLLPRIDDRGRVTSIVVVTRNVTEEERTREEVEELRRLVPVCSWCKKIRDDEGFWQELETYLEDVGEGFVTHGMCPDCEAKLTGDGEKNSA